MVHVVVEGVQTLKYFKPVPFSAVLCCYTCTEQQYCLRPELCLAQYPSSKVKPSHITFSNSSSLCFRNFLCQRCFLFADQPQKDFPSLSLFSCPLNPCKVLAAVTSPGKEFLSFLSQLHGELLPHVCFPPAICLLHLMPPALSYNGQQTVSSDSPLPCHSWFHRSLSYLLWIIALPGFVAVAPCKPVYTFSPPSFLLLQLCTWVEESELQIIFKMQACEYAETIVAFWFFSGLQFAFPNCWARGDDVYTEDLPPQDLIPGQQCACNSVQNPLLLSLN